MKTKQLLALAGQAKQMNFFFEKNLDERSKKIAQNAAMQALAMTKRRR